SSAGLIMESLMASIFRPWIEDYALSHSLDLSPSRLLATISGRHSHRMRHSLHGHRRAQEFQIPLRLQNKPIHGRRHHHGLSRRETLWRRSFKFDHAIAVQRHQTPYTLPGLRRTTKLPCAREMEFVDDKARRGNQ